MLKQATGFFLTWALAGSALAQTRPLVAPPKAPSGVEAGLEEAVKWKWLVVPSDEKLWGLELPEPPPPAPVQGTPLVAPQRDSLTSYEVKKGDALVLIGKKFGLSVAQLKAANGLKDDMIRIGQIIRLPTVEECIALGLPPEPPTPRVVPGGKKGTPASPNNDAQLDQEIFLLQVFLDRENFSSGPIDGKTSLDFQKLVYLYQSHHGDTGDTALLTAKAKASVGEVVTKYILKPEDFRFIAPPKAEKASDQKTPTPPPKGKAAPKATPVPPMTYADMTSSGMLAYQTPWEFVAERFKCREDLLRLLNPGIKPVPAAGTEFRVPNVIPFAIEKAFDSPLQPPADPQNVITAAAVDLSRLEIYRNDRLIAVMPIATARPGLRGKGTWKILDALPRPRLSTLREPREVPKPASTFFIGENSATTPAIPILSTAEFLPPGPNNPLGILWINLAKSDSPDPLPYGLHGTSIPSQMNSKSGLGGFRLANWDILRAVRLLPWNTPLEWKQSSSPAPQSARPAL
ncbi:MAG: L,D-transpeptidase family protein [Terrimicrobiaceae bacterium]